MATTRTAVATSPIVHSTVRPAQYSRSRLPTLVVRSQQKHVDSAANAGLALGRREMLSAAAASPLFLAPFAAFPRPAVAKDDKSVGAYLPVFEEDKDLVLFVPGPRETPAIRAGTINPNQPYRFGLPPNWARDPVANIASGNYCQPRCAEPWTEVIFSAPTDGKCQVIISPLVRFINKSDASLSEIGPPEGVVNSIGPYITGTTVEEEDIISCTSEEKGGRLYYKYELYAPYGTQPPHGLAVLTTKGDAAIMFVINANDKQWSKSEEILRKMANSFSV